jgi:hypothetical protein
LPLPARLPQVPALHKPWAKNNPTKADDITKGEIITRKQAWAIWRLLKDRVAGFEESVIVETAPQVGIRESRCITGDYVLTTDNRQFEDSVQTSTVFQDSHDKSKYRTGGRGLVDVPYRVFLPRGLESVLTAGRCTSCDHLMNSAFRRMESAFQSGEVAGTAAAMAASRGKTPRELPVKVLQAELRRHGFKTCQKERS